MNSSKTTGLMDLVSPESSPTGQLDGALKSLAAYAPEYSGGLPNTGSVIATLLTTLGGQPILDTWLAEYRMRLDALPPPLDPVSRHNHPSALGNMSRIGDWTNFFIREVHRTGWETTLADWLPRLMSGLAGAGGFSAMRTSYAASNLRRGVTEVREDEFAYSLAYWASTYLRLPGIPTSGSSGPYSPLIALRRIKWQHKHRRTDFPSVGSGLLGLKGFPSFPGVINLVSLPDNPRTFISTLTDAFARVFLAQLQYPDTLLPVMGVVSTTSALRFLLPQVSRQQSSLALRYAWQFAGAVYAVYGQANPVTEVPLITGNQDTIMRRALESGNDHVIIYVASCLREYRLSAKPVYLAAASSALDTEHSPQPTISVLQ
ncbi:hypothetical protein ACFLZR_00425 [Candidatus Neomarinimicrobiota bacterium]